MSIPAIASVSSVGPSTSVNITASIAQMQSQLSQLEQAEASQSNAATRAQLALAVEQVEEQLQQAQQAAQPKPAETVHSLPLAPTPEVVFPSPDSAAGVPTSDSGPSLNTLA
jgi:hypothetical protein